MCPVLKVNPPSVLSSLPAYNVVRKTLGIPRKRFGPDSPTQLLDELLSHP